MRIVYQRCCGMDVHKDSVTACLLVTNQHGTVRMQKRQFGTMTRDLREMASWLASEGVQAIAMEATGVYWKPVWNILDAEKKFELLLVNAQHIECVYLGEKPIKKTVSGLLTCYSMVYCAQAFCRLWRYGAFAI